MVYNARPNFIQMRCNNNFNATIRILCLVVAYATATQAPDKMEDETCNFYLKRVHETNEIGVFAARDYAAGEVIERASAVMVYRNVTGQTILEVLIIDIWVMSSFIRINF